MSNDPQILHPADITRNAGSPPAESRSAVSRAAWIAAPDGNRKAGHYLWLLRRHGWKCLAFAAVCLGATAIITARITPLYESTATIDIDRQVPVGIIGQDSARPGANDADQFLATQIRVIQSDSVLRPVALRYHLLDPLGDAHADTPVALKNLRVTRPPNTYLLAITYTSPDPRLSADVANAISVAYIDHVHEIQYRSSAGVASFMEKHLEGIKAKVELSSEALARFERDLNMINPEEKTSILSGRLVQLNAEYTNAEADRVRKQASYEAVKLGALEAAQVSSQGEALKELSARFDEAQQKLAQVDAHFGPNHPEHTKAAAQVNEIQRQIRRTHANIARRVEVEYRQALSREEMLQRSLARTKIEFDKMNAGLFRYQGLKREAEADRKLYDELQRKIKESGINAGFQSSAIRIGDPARPTDAPVRPNKPLNLSLAFFLSSLVSVFAVVIHDAMNSAVRDPESLALSLNSEIVGTLPRARTPQLRLLSSTPAGVRVRSLADASVYAYDAAVRSLRNSVLFGDGGRRVRCLMVASPATAEGKSTISFNLAVANAQQGYRTLLLDCDLRRPTIHSQAGISDSAGLSKVLRGDAAWRDVIVKHESEPRLDMLLGGSALPGDAELVGESLPAILAEARGSYDLIVVDSAPMLGFPEPLQIATQVDGVLMVAHAGRTSRRSLATALGVVSRLGVRTLGIVLNDVCPATTRDSSHYNPYGAYQKYYRARA